MVSFSCEECGDILTKKKLDPHRSRCRGATFTCIDCMVHFQGVDYRSHTACMSEEQKYQGALYKDKTKKQQKQPTRTDESEVSKMKGKTAFVEDVAEDRDYSSWDDDDGPADIDKYRSGPPPEAPSPPSAANEDHVNVFDFMIATGQTPNASNTNLSRQQLAREDGDSTSLVRYERREEEYVFMDDDEGSVQYGTGPVPANKHETPATKTERRRSKDGELKKDKKRKRLHVDVPGDQVMTDAPPVLHSGLTGGLKGLLRPVLPPSPDYSGNDGTEPSPASPTKKTKHSKHAKHGQVSNSIFDMLTGGPKPKTKKHKTSKKPSRRHRDDRAPKLIEYRSETNHNNDDTDGQMIIYKPRADVFLSFVNKGPESERGCSVNKALKRFHRERQAAGSDMGKGKEEKELWRSLRLRRNDRGEIVLFSEEFDLAEEV